jgi:hypothetical protein
VRALDTLCADIVAKVPNRWELIFLLLKKNPPTTANRLTEVVSQVIVRR